MDDLKEYNHGDDPQGDEGAALLPMIAQIEITNVLFEYGCDWTKGNKFEYYGNSGDEKQRAFLMLVVTPNYSEVELDVVKVFFLHADQGELADLALDLCSLGGAVVHSVELTDLYVGKKWLFAGSLGILFPRK